MNLNELHTFFTVNMWIIASTLLNNVFVSFCLLVPRFRRGCLHRCHLGKTRHPVFAYNHASGIDGALIEVDDAERERELSWTPLCPVD